MKLSVTEERNEKTYHLDEMSALDIVTEMNREDKKVAEAVQKCLPTIALAIECVADAFQHNGRLLYFGAGTSGRLGVLDAAECPPTFGVKKSMVMGVIAGGNKALKDAVESAEDCIEAGIADLTKLKPTKYDVVMGISAGGNTPYVVGALKYAHKIGMRTIGYSSNPQAQIKKLSDIFINPIVGPEILTGSSRLKSGTAQKMVLNMISTGAMIRIGKVYENLMIDVRIVNQKLRWRAERIIADISGVSLKKAGSYLDEAQQFLHDTTTGVPLAVVMAVQKCTPQQAYDLLQKHEWSVRHAMQADLM